MRYLLTAVIVFALLPVNLTVAAAEKCEIHWLYPDQPPIFITSGYGAGMGMGQQTMHFFANHLSGCTSVYTAANYQRIITTLRNSDDACCVSLYPTPERKEFIEFTIPVRIALANSLIVLESQKARFKPYMDGKGHVSLEELLKNGFRIGIAKGRIYQGVIDETLKKYRGNPQILEHPSPDNMVGKLIDMMAIGRVDAVIGYPSEGQYYARMTEKKEKVISIHIARMEEYQISYAGCSKSPKGKAIVKRLNTILLKYRKSPRFMGFAEYWLDEESTRRFREYTNREFK